VLPLEQSLVGLTVRVEIVDCEVGEDGDEGLVAVMEFGEVSEVLKRIIIRWAFTIFQMLYYLVVELWVPVATW
jgi:hypothetical protein